jgi:site-specific recombinase XerD
MKCYLKGYNLRDWLLFVLGINSGLRVSDLLALQIEDVSSCNRVLLREKKTGKAKDFPLSDNCKKAIQEYIKTTELTTGPLFPSRKTDGCRGTGAISRQQAYKTLHEAARAVGIKEAIGTHTLRKTFGYWAFKQGVDVTRIQQLLNHSSPSVTLRYIGITKDELDRVYINLNL